jgi:hypothetical protein
MVTGSPHQVAARIRSDRRIREVARYELAPGRHLAIVERIKPEPSRARRVALWALVAFIAVSATGVALWALLKALAPLVAAAAPGIAVLVGLWCLIKILTGHRAACVGLHCPGCRH